MSAVRYTFDTEFKDEIDVVPEAVRARRRQTLTEAELDALRSSAHSEGMQAGEIRALEAVAAGTREVIHALRAALAHTAAEAEGLRAQSTGIALAAARKLARAALAAFPAAEIERCLRDAMHQAIGEPRIVLRAAPAVAEALSSGIDEIAHEEGFEGRVQISADPALTNADCRIEWRGGGAERIEAALEAALDDLVARRFSDVAPVQLMED